MTVWRPSISQSHLSLRHILFQKDNTFLPTGVCQIYKHRDSECVKYISIEIANWANINISLSIWAVFVTTQSSYPINEALFRMSTQDAVLSSWHTEPASNKRGFIFLTNVFHSNSGIKEMAYMYM